MGVFTEIKDNQWQRRVDGGYEMCWAVYMREWDMGSGCFAITGSFSISDYPQDEVEWAKENHHLGPDATDDKVAAALFENCGADFDVEVFDTHDEALAYVRGWMAGRE